MEDYSEINQKIAKNLIYYRKRAGLTQAELAEKINYSDKSVSKWEQGNAIPDVYILLQLSKLYRVSIAVLLGEEPLEQVQEKRSVKSLHLLIMLLSSGIVWLVATCLFVALRIISPTLWPWWQLFVYASCANAIVLLVYACIWKYRILNFISVSILIWTAITSIYLAILASMSIAGTSLSGLWCMYLIGIPLQILEILWSFFRSLFRKHHGERKTVPYEGD